MRQASARAWLVAMLFAATFAIAQAAAPVAPATLPVFEAVPLQLDAWVGTPAPPLAPEVAKTLAADQYVHRFYWRDDARVEMDVAYYAQPRVGANMHSPLNCLPGNGWTMSEPRQRTIATAAGAVDVREITVRRGSTAFAMTYWFQNRTRIVNDEFAARWHLLGDALRRVPTDASLVRVMTPARDETEHATLALFAAELIPELQAVLSR
jgi:EpsI family protein